MRASVSEAPPDTPPAGRLNDALRRKQPKRPAHGMVVASATLAKGIDLLPSVRAKHTERNVAPQG